MKIDPRRIEVVDDRVAEILRRMSGAERLRLASEIWESARFRIEAYLRENHPQWSDRALLEEIHKRYGLGA
jgi:hypothetical protein